MIKIFDIRFQNDSRGGKKGIPEGVDFGKTTTGLQYDL